MFEPLLIRSTSKLWYPTIENYLAQKGVKEEDYIFHHEIDEGIHSQLEDKKISLAYSLNFTNLIGDLNMMLNSLNSIFNENLILSFPQEDIISHPSLLDLIFTRDSVMVGK